MTTPTKVAAPVAGMPVEIAQQRLAGAEQAEEEARLACAELRERVLNGEDITARQLAEAGEVLSRAELGTEATGIALAGAQKRARAERLAQLKATALTDTGDADEVTALIAQIEESVARVIAICATRRGAIQRTMRALRTEGVPQLDVFGKVRTDAQGRTSTPYTEVSSEHGGMGWKEASMGGDDRIFINDRMIEGVHPGVIVAAAIERACKRSEMSTRSLAPLVSVDRPAERVTSDLAGWAAGTFRSEDNDNG